MKWIGAFLAMISCGATLALLGFLMIGRSAEFILWPAWFVALAMAITVWKTKLPDAAQDWERPGPLGLFVLAVATLFILRTAFWLVWEDGVNIFVGSPNNSGDLALHLSHVRYLASGNPFWPANPIAADDPLTYPPGFAIWTLMLQKAGLSWTGMFILGSLLGLSLVVAACWRWGGAFGVAVLMFNGGLAGFAFLQSTQLVDYQSALAWKSIPLSILVTQRGFLYAIPAGIWLLCRWREVFIRGSGKVTWLDWWIYASLPLFHIHSFIALSLFLLAWFLVGIRRKALLLYVALAAPAATGFVWGVTGGFKSTGGFGWAWGWFQGDGQLATSLLINFGLWLLILPALTAWLIYRILGKKAGDREKEAAAFVIPGLVIFTACFFVRLQPWAWDNTKMMLWGWLAAAPFAWSVWFSRMPRAASIPLLAALFFSGFITLIGGLRDGLSGFEFANRVEIALADMLRKAIPPNEKVAAAPDYNHPLLLAGQPLVLGYEGHLWSHGIDYTERLEHLRALMRGEPTWRAHADKLGVKYLYWGRKEYEAFPESTHPWVKDAELIATNPGGSLYRLK